MLLRKIHLFAHTTILLSISGLLVTTPVTVGETWAETSILESRILKVGTPAPVFSAEDLEGTMHNLGDVLGKKPVLIFFWSFFCGPCREELPVLQEIYSEIGQDNMKFIGINLDGKGLGRAINKFITDGNYKFINLFDEPEGVSYKVADPYGITGTPTAYVIDLDGKIAFSNVGHIQADELKQIIEGILGGS